MWSFLKMSLHFMSSGHRKEIKLLRFLFEKLHGHIWWSRAIRGRRKHPIIGC